MTDTNNDAASGDRSTDYPSTTATQSQKARRDQERFGYWLTESALFCGVAFGAVGALALFAASHWGTLMLFNGDSLLLPLVDRSVDHGEHFDWVMSSPIFVFPEIPTYLVLSEITPSVQWALILNGVVNLCLTYVVLRLIAGKVFRQVEVSRVVALLHILLILLFVRLERNSTQDVSMASYLFFNTYYIGTIIVGLAGLYLVVCVVGPVSADRRLLVLALLLLVALGTASNPLVSIQFSGPLVVACALMVALGLAGLRRMAEVGATVVAATVLGLLLRLTVFKSWIVVDVNGYVRPFDLPSGLSALARVFINGLADERLRYEYLIITCAVVACCAFFARAVLLRSGGDADAERSNSDRLVAVFGGCSVMFMLASVVVANNVLIRYLIPLTIVPFLSFWPLVNKVTSTKSAARLSAASWGAVSLLLLVGIARLERVADMAERVPEGMDCLDLATSGRDGMQTGVAFFWRARALDVYADRARVLQVGTDFHPFLWLTNVDTFRRDDVSFVLVDTPGTPGLSITDAEMAQLGDPSERIACGSFDVVFFEPGTAGYRTLNDRVDATLAGYYDG